MGAVLARRGFATAFTGGTGPVKRLSAEMQSNGRMQVSGPTRRPNAHIETGCAQSNPPADTVRR